jgi:hypothetical protein
MYIVKVNDKGFDTYFKHGKSEIDCGLTHNIRDAWHFETKKGAEKIAKKFKNGSVLRDCFTLNFHNGSHFTDEIAHTMEFTPNTPIEHIELVARQVNKNKFNNKRIWIDLLRNGKNPVTHWIFNY